MSLAMSMAMTDAAQPMPDRLKERMLCLNLKWFTIFADREGVGLNAEQFTISASICRQHQSSLRVLDESEQNCFAQLRS